MAKELVKPHIWEINGQTIFPVYGADGGLTADLAVYVVIGDVRKEVRFTWQELTVREEATAT